MKKYTVLGLSTILAIAAIGGISSVIRPSHMPVNLYTVTAQTVRHTVEYAGKVESAESKSVYTDVTCIAGDVLVKTGQMVEKGDVLFTIDVDATKQVATTLGNSSGYTLPDPDSVDMPQEITAPVRGIVTSLHVSEGEFTDTAKPCVVISSGESLQVKVGVPEKGVSHIAVGQEVTLSGVAFEKDSYRGTIAAISPSARTQMSGTVSETVVDTTITIHPEDIDESLRIGLSAKACITLNVSPNALIVPYEAVMQDAQEQEYVYVYRNGKAMKQVVVTGAATEEGFEIRQGLADGDRVVTSPEKVTQNGMAVTAI